jgi:hypothetical protein
MAQSPNRSRGRPRRQPRRDHVRKKAEKEVLVLLQRREGGRLRRFRKRFLMGNEPGRLLTKAELRKRLSWDESQTRLNDYRIEAIKTEWQATADNLRDQFAKVGVTIALLGFIIGLGLRDTADDRNRLAIQLVCSLAIVALWAQSPRGKIFRFRKRQDAGLRTGSIKSQFDLFYYYYDWTVRRESTTNAIEVLLFIVTILASGVLGYLISIL